MWLVGAALKLLAALVGVIVLFVVWRIYATFKGGRDRDDLIYGRILPLAERIRSREPVTKDDVLTLAAQPENRFSLFAMLRAAGRTDLLPDQFLSSADQGTSALVEWMMHPNELERAPEVIEFVEAQRRSVGTVDFEFNLYRYRMPTGHWAGDEWILGITGPMPVDSDPYNGHVMAFSRASDVEGKTKPSDLVDWWLSMLQQKGVLQPNAGEKQS